MDDTPDAPSTIHITHRSDRSLLMRLLQLLVKPFGSYLIKPKPPQSAFLRLTPHRAARRKCHITERQVEGIWIYDMTAKHSDLPPPPPATPAHPEPPRKNRMYYFPGGSWQMPASSQHWHLCAYLATHLPRTTISLVSTPLAPRAPAPDAFPRLLSLYAALLRAAVQADEAVTLAGDSSGGNVVLGLTLRALGGDAGAGAGALAPERVLVISPAMDLTYSNPAMREVEKRDPILNVAFSSASARPWIGGWDATDPRLSPVHADVRVLRERGVRVVGVTGGRDILTPDALVFRERCQKEGVWGSWLEWEGQMHCFPLTWVYGLREGREGVEWIVRILREGE